MSFLRRPNCGAKLICDVFVRKNEIIEVPFVAKQLGIKYSKCTHAEIISSIVASSMLQEELEITMAESAPDKIALSNKKIHNILTDRGALPESIMISSMFQINQFFVYQLQEMLN